MKEPKLTTSSIPRGLWRHHLVTRYLGAPDHRFKTTAARLLRRALGLKDVFLETRNGTRYLLDPTDYLQDQMLRYGASEPDTLNLLCRLLRPGAVFVDVGGHIGQFSVEAAHAVGEAGRVVAFEPNPRTFLYLKKNVSLNALKNVTLILGAATSEPAVIGMIDPPQENWGMSRATPAKSSADSYHVSGLTIASALRGLGVNTIDVLKMDVEGHELPALAGLFGSGGLRPENLIIEFVPDGFDYGLTLPECLRQNGYDLFTVLGEVYAGNPPVHEGNLWAVRNG